MTKPYPWSNDEPIGVINLGDLCPQTALYRYMDYDRFVCWIETKQTSLTRALAWEDKWELPITRLLQQQRPMEYAGVEEAFQEQFAQCWSLHRDNREMWDGFCKNNKGIMIKTSVGKFSVIKELKYAVLSPIVYCDDRMRGIELAAFQEIGLHPLVFLSTSALVKGRIKYAKENEVRLVAMRGLSFSTDLPLIDDKFVSIPLDPLGFIEEVLIHPDAESDHAAAVDELCSSHCLGVIPQKSGACS